MWVGEKKSCIVITLRVIEIQIYEVGMFQNSCRILILDNCFLIGVYHGRLP